MKIKKGIVLEVLQKIPAQGWYCLITELDDMDVAIMATPCFKHIETAVLDALYKIRAHYANREVTIKTKGRSSDF